MPDAVVVSASFAWTRIRSSSGLIATFVAVVTGIPSWGIGFAYIMPPGASVVAGAGNPGLDTSVSGTLTARVLTGGYSSG
jgi:hypothetical protein